MMQAEKKALTDPSGPIPASNDLPSHIVRLDSAITVSVSGSHIRATHMTARTLVYHEKLRPSKKPPPFPYGHPRKPNPPASPVPRLKIQPRQWHINMEGLSNIIHS